MEWSQAVRLTGQGAPYVGDILDRAFDAAQAVVVLLTPDDIAYLRPEYAGDLDPEREPAGQARPNVLFEAGMAFGRHPHRTILVEIGALRPFSDVVGRHSIRMDGSPEKRQELVNRLDTAGCTIDRHRTDWLTTGVFAPPPDPGGGHRLGRRIPVPIPERRLLYARYQAISGGTGRLTVKNQGTEDVFDLNVELPDGVGHHIDGLPLDRLPAGEQATFRLTAWIGSGPEKFPATITAVDAEGHTITTSKFIDMI